MGDEEETPLDRLNRAVHQYYKETEPDAFIGAWVLCADTDEPKVKESEFDIRPVGYSNIINIATAPDCRWSTSVGILRIAIKHKEKPR